MPPPRSRLADIERPGWNSQVGRLLQRARGFLIPLTLVVLFLNYVQPPLTESERGFAQEQMESVAAAPAWPFTKYDALLLLAYPVSGVFLAIGFDRCKCDKDCKCAGGGGHCCAALAVFGLTSIYFVAKTIRFCIVLIMRLLCGIRDWDAPIHSNLVLAVISVAVLGVVALAIDCCMKGLHDSSRMRYLISETARHRTMHKICDRWFSGFLLGWTMTGVAQWIFARLDLPTKRSVAPAFMMAMAGPQFLCIALHEIVPFEISLAVARMQLYTTFTTSLGLAAALNIEEAWRGVSWILGGFAIAILLSLCELVKAYVQEQAVRTLQGAVRQSQLKREASRERHQVDLCRFCGDIATALNSPCGHMFLCYRCAVSFQEHEGNVCNSCRLPSRLTYVRPLEDTCQPTDLTRSSNPFQLMMNYYISERARSAQHQRHKELYCRSCGPNTMVRASVLERPCGHSVHCFDCAGKWREEHGERCPKCNSGSTIEHILTKQTCLICSDEFAGKDLIAVSDCGHQFCVGCCVTYVREALGEVASHVKPQGLRCPWHFDGCDKFLTVTTVQANLRGRRCASEPEGEPFSKTEEDRLDRFVEEAGIPFECQYYCVNSTCARMQSVNITEVLARDEPKITCKFCGTAQCARCKILWHGALTCQEVSRMASKSKDPCDHTSIIDATSKACPKCKLRISHYHGHACHHIAPGGGCPNCGYHFCYRCLSKHGSCRCPLYCSNLDLSRFIVKSPYPYDSRCGCVICPDCRPEKPCAQCDGSCAVCRGLLPPGEMVQSSQHAKPKGIFSRVKSVFTFLGR